MRTKSNQLLHLLQEIGLMNIKHNIMPTLTLGLISLWVKRQLAQGTHKWVDEFAKERQHSELEDQWVNDFSKLHVQDWAEEFGQQMGEGAFGQGSADNWADAYDKYLGEELTSSKQRSDASRGIYVFSDMNPYVGHANPMKEGQELFRKGLLSEAVLALEAEVLKNPENSEGWRLLGITHAENDDDQQAIASMMRAQEADPTNLEVLLALGVSYTNEFEQPEALKYLYRWLQNHPKYGSLAPPERTDSLYYADVARLFNDAAQMSPEDADVHIVLGVLYNLSREYDKAIESFQTALKLKPRDYSLWNKLGATQANSIQSADAILAYQQALDLKPNYVRAWANMGISYANQGLYEESIRYYVRALAMNPKADSAWQYLRISLSCASRHDMFEACDLRNLDLLQKEFPL
ncbi:peroxisome biogenesis protein 5 [Iris pallida]|uniref:Peroxisome biogenesis protein 5 n=1 Tax=Iris pallida TaxID=29817 RepID=A0AAX6IFZ2_IRIPA|nr:peroxisome biogenesis protein 5 [Iris pallida]KAJ6852176.1 peroxisome biogenesis protein 5 [Iris pallida]